MSPFSEQGHDQLLVDGIVFGHQYIQCRAPARAVRCPDSVAGGLSRHSLKPQYLAQAVDEYCALERLGEESVEPNMPGVVAGVRQPDRCRQNQLERPEFRCRADAARQGDSADLRHVLVKDGYVVGISISRRLAQGRHQIGWFRQRCRIDARRFELAGDGAPVEAGVVNHDDTPPAQQVRA